MSAPLISVIIPAYNAARFLRETLRSAQEQSYPNIEIIVVDDGSRDETPQVVAEAAEADARIQLHQQSNKGVATARNRGIEVARGAFIAPLDADDCWYPDKLRLQMARFIEVGAAVGVVYSDYDEVDQQMRVIPRLQLRHLPEGDLADEFVLRNPIPCASTPLIRRVVLSAVGGYDVTLRETGGQGCEDWDLYLRLAEQTQFAVVPVPLLAYRHVRGSMSTDPAQMLASYEALMNRLKKRRPALTSALCRRSRSRFFQYLAGVCRDRGERVAAARFALRAIRADPARLLNRSAWRAWPVLLRRRMS